MTSKMVELLNQHHHWPCRYSFKFIIPEQQLDTLTALLPKEGLTQKPSAKGKYISITAELPMNSAQDVLDIYEKVAGIPGIITL